MLGSPTRFAPLLAITLALAACGHTPPVSEEARKLVAAADCSHMRCVDFIYIHGAATHTEDDRQYMLERVEALHAALSARLYDTPEFVEGALDGGRLQIATDPRLYFWGGEFALMRDLETLEAMLASQKQREGRGATKFFAAGHRRLSEAIHDLFWAAEDGHRYSITDSLHATVRESRGAGRRVVLVGYSAGAVVASIYFTYRTPINLDEFSQIIRGSEVLPALFTGRNEWTCAEALFSSGLVEIGPTGLLQARLERYVGDDGGNLDELRYALWAESLRRLPALTERLCLDGNTLLGRIEFGSMVNLLASKTDDAEGEFFVLAAREGIRRGKFFLNVNHADDLVGFNTYEDVKLFARLQATLGLEPAQGRGFERSAEPYFRGANFTNAHQWYIRKPEEFAPVVADTYARGYRDMLKRVAAEERIPANGD